MIYCVKFREVFEYNLVITASDSVSRSQYLNCFYSNFFLSLLFVVLNVVLSWKCALCSRSSYELIS